MNIFDRKHKSLLNRYDDLKKVLHKSEKELIRLRRLVRVQHLNDNIDKVDLIHNIKNYLEAEFVLDLSTKTRLQPYVKARCMFYWFAKRYTSMSLKEIGAMVGGLDHSTVIHGITITEQYLSQDKHFARDLKRFDEYIVNNFIDPKTQGVEEIKSEIQRLTSELSKHGTNWMFPSEFNQVQQSN